MYCIHGYHSRQSDANSSPSTRLNSIQRCEVGKSSHPTDDPCTKGKTLPFELDTKTMSAARFDVIENREKGLRRGLTSAQLTMIAIGGAIGTGLFLGSSFAISFAGPAVIVSYAIGALIALLLMGCLAEMTVAHPTSGSFGAWAEFYVGPLAGYLVRYAYWSAIVFAVGTEVTAIAVYMRFWYPAVPGWVWIVGFSSILIAVNAFDVKVFGSIEYAFSTLKVTAIMVFILLGGWLLAGIGLGNYTAHGGFFPKGAWGMWVAVAVAIFSYFGIEMIAVAAGEAEDPQKAITKAYRSTVARLVLFYLLAMAIILGIVPWIESGKGQSPFVTVMARSHVPFAAGVVNFVILVAALSAMNSQLYITARMMFSLARAGYAPRRLGKLSSAWNAGCRAPAVVDRHRACDPAQCAVPQHILYADVGYLHVWRAVRLDDDIRDPPVFSPRPCRQTAGVPHVGLPVCEFAGRRVGGGNSADHCVYQGVPHDPRLWIAGAGLILPGVETAKAARV